MKYADMSDRIMALSVLCTATGCWLWLGQVKTGKGGSPRGKINVRVDGRHRKLQAHRASYEAFKRAVPEGHEVNHTCECTICVNPDHLVATTHSRNMVQENARRARQRAYA